MNYRIINIIKRKKTEIIIMLLSHRFYLTEVKKINDTHFIWKRKINKRIQKKNKSFKDVRSKRIKRHSSEKTNQLITISNKISYLNQNTEINSRDVDRFKRDENFYVLNSYESRRIQHSQTWKKLFNINCQRKRTWHENCKKNNIHDHDNSELSRSISF